MAIKMKQVIEKETILDVKNLTFAYEQEKVALENISISIQKGEKVAILGANGAGKSTFFLTINGVLHPQSGDIYYRGEAMTHKNVNTFRKNIGIVFQDADNQMIASTVKAEVSFGPMNLKLPKEEVSRRVDAALNYMNLSDFQDRPPHYLSGGEKKRVSIADIIAMESEIIIFDEPTAALDPVNAVMLEEVLTKLSDEKKTILLSTHDVDLAYRFADRILVFCDGKIIADGTPLEVFENDGILKKANLKKPMLLEIVQTLKQIKKLDCLQRSEEYPTTIEGLKGLLLDNES